MSSPNLALPHIAEGQASKHVTHNDAIDAIDGALTDRLDVDLSGGNGGVTAAQMKAVSRIRATGRCVCPEMTAANPAAFASRSSAARSWSM